MSVEKRDVFISYHTSTAIETVKALVAALENAGISCWYAPRDCEGDFAESIVRAIRKCRVFLFVLNESSGQSEHCKNEVSQAFSRYSAHDEITLLPVRIEDCGLSDGLSYYLNRFHIMDGGIPPQELKLVELLARVKRILSVEDFREAEVPFAASSGETGTRVYRLLSGMQYPDTGFTGREKELAAIGGQLSQADNKVILVGMGGMGKSEIAKMYLKRHAGDYDVVRWIPFETSLAATVASDTALPIEGISRAEWASDSEEDYARRKLRILSAIADRRVLLAVDNFDVQGDPWLKEFCEGPYSVLFTTRNHQRGSGIREIEILPMTDEEELLQLFTAEYKRAMTPEEERCAREILCLLEGHPLSIRLIASAMQARRIRPDKMLGLLKENGGEIRENDKLADLIYGRLHRVFQLSSLSEKELYALKNLALVPVSGIDVETFSDWCGADFDEIDALIDRSWIIHDAVQDQIHLHPLVADLMLEEVEKDPSCADAYIEGLTGGCKGGWDASYPKKIKLTELAGALYDRLPGTHPLRAEAQLARADMLMNMSMRTASIPLYKELWEAGQGSLERQMLICQKLAQARVLNGDAAGCCAVAEEGLERIRAVPEEERSPELQLQTNGLVTRLAQGYRDLGDHGRSVKYARLLVDRTRRYSGAQPEKDLGWALAHLARSLHVRDASGDQEEAEQVLLETIRLFESICDQGARGYAYDLMGQILMKQGRFEEALSMSAEGRELRLPLLGEEHMDIANNYVWRGNIYRAMGDIPHAREYYDKALRIYGKRGSAVKQEQVESLLKELQ